ncbi:YybH family protein [Rhizosphaericola mali]|uniref:Nuclear transport factor 2 family protein n=1 Tax=Rhizosphaericola mali TaxID=2545455 RepID=A0A5P2G375_9BACT|nr:nuclear transport factor 2 family protein [Rhizosphaericola mali]QES90274.1 nuclear transport factor 2 family protein [Rhizosphaericola mali]
MKRISFLLIYLSFLQISFAQKHNATAEKEILNTLHRQQDFWNKGDLVHFMEGYWNNDSLVFIGGSGPNYGYEGALKSYQKTYPDKSKMGILQFSNIQLKPLDKTHYLVIGKWELERATDHPSGYYSLIFQWIDHKWLIILDHSS